MEDIAAPTPPPDSARRIRAEIERFIREDREFEGDPREWIASAARRVMQLQQVTHSAKFTHPSTDWKVAGLLSTGNPSADQLELGTHALSEPPPLEVVGNAAVLDIYKFVCLSVDGRDLLDRAMVRDPALLAALDADEAMAAKWAEAFASLPIPKGTLASHKLAKQVYWPIGDGNYHLLSPLLSSPLAHALRPFVQESRFPKVSKAAREAREKGKFHSEGFHDYPHHAIQSFGGSKPQNISQLNSERRGENLLLASLPPLWESPTLRPPLKTDSVFLRYYPYRREVRRIAGVLKEYLRGVALRRSNMHMRYTRATLVSELVDEVLNMAAELRRGLEPGWTAQPDCQLRLAEQHWLDPERGETDDAFATGIAGDGWKDEVCKGFANWLNSALQTDKTAFGEGEAREWTGILKQELNLLREELADD